MLTPAAFEPAGRKPRQGKRGLRFWSVRRARLMERLYTWLEAVLHGLGPIVKRIGPNRAEGPVKFFEAGIKKTLFDCRMCGQCILSSTGMSCPMNCPKNLRNGPCGGVRADGNCEVYPDMPCVWVEAWEGAQRMAEGDKIRAVQPVVDHRLKGRSSWVAVATGEHTGA
ncbi:MAG: methylenetetrahydrofolate reductase C-terminal domain-containing protein [Pseudomonadota bacterium]